MKLSEITTVEVNNENCVVLKVKENKFIELVSLGCFDGSETMFRLTKGGQHTCTVWHGADNKSYSWDWGVYGYTLVSDKLREQGSLIYKTIEKDFNIDLE